LLFAREISHWHPRCEVRIVRVSGQSLGVGKDYNISPRDDQTVRGNILHILQTAWDTLRPYLTQTKLVESGIFRENLVYPEEACREALINAVAHRDYSIEGKGIEILIFDDRLEVKSPGGLLSSISINDLRTGKRTHQSRNAYLARVLREFGYMREMGEGMLRIFRTMRDRDLVAPELDADGTRFDIHLHHRSVFAPKEQEWLRAYGPYNLSRDEQRTILLGRDGHHLSTNQIMKTLGIVDTDEFRKLVEHLRRKGILYNVVGKASKGVGARARREMGRFAIRPPDQTEQYLLELVDVLRKMGSRSAISPQDLTAMKRQLSSSSPFLEAPHDSLKLLGFADERLRPLPALNLIWSDPATSSVDSSIKFTESQGARSAQVAPRFAPPTFVGKVVVLSREKGIGFIKDDDNVGFYLHKTALNGISWEDIDIGTRVRFELSFAEVRGKPRAARNVQLEAASTRGRAHGERKVQRKSRW
jgi:cold shock CspA family protein